MRARMRPALYRVSRVRAFGLTGVHLPGNGLDERTRRGRITG